MKGFKKIEYCVFSSFWPARRSPQTRRPQKPAEMAISRRILATALFAIALILLLDTPSFGRSPSLYRHDLSSDTRRAPSLLFVAAEDAASGQTEKWEEEDEEGDDVPVAKKGGKAAGAGAGGAQQPRATWGEYLANIPWHLLRLDAAMVALVVIYYVNSFRGQSANFNLAKKWAAATLETWREQFAKIGDENGHTLMVDSARDTLFYASGRENVRKCLGYLKVGYDETGRNGQELRTYHLAHS